jgi:hypothetical protein
MYQSAAETTRAAGTSTFGSAGARATVKAKRR